MTVVILLAALMSKAQTPSIANGSVSGIVLNEDGQPVGQARVCLSKTQGNQTSNICRFLADETGQFHIDNVAFGEYEIFAIKEEDGYALEKQQPGQKLQITADDPLANVTIRMAPKGAVLVGSVRDKLTGQEIKERATVQFFALDAGTSGGSGGRAKDGRFQIAVPTGVDLVVVVKARGYNGWVYTDPNNPSRPVMRLRQGEKKLLDIEMEPRQDTQATNSAPTR